MQNKELTTILNQLKKTFKTGNSNLVAQGKLLIQARAQFENEEDFKQWRADYLGDHLTLGNAYKAMLLAESFPKGLPARIPEDGCYILAYPGNRKLIPECLTEIAKIKGLVTVKDVKNVLSVIKGHDDRKHYRQGRHHVELDPPTHTKATALQQYYDAPNLSRLIQQLVDDSYEQHIE